MNSQRIITHHGSCQLYGGFCLFSLIVLFFLPPISTPINPVSRHSNEPEKALINPLYASCPAPNGRKTKLASQWRQMLHISQSLKSQIFSRFKHPKKKKDHQTIHPELACRLAHQIVCDKREISTKPLLEVVSTWPHSSINHYIKCYVEPQRRGGGI